MLKSYLKPFPQLISKLPIIKLILKLRKEFNKKGISIHSHAVYQISLLIIAIYAAILNKITPCKMLYYGCRLLQSTQPGPDFSSQKQGLKSNPPFRSGPVQVPKIRHQHFYVLLCFTAPTKNIWLEPGFTFICGKKSANPEYLRC